jgi:hypothetical protein
MTLSAITATVDFVFILVLPDCVTGIHNATTRWIRVPALPPLQRCARNSSARQRIESRMCAAGDPRRKGDWFRAQGDPSTEAAKIPIRGVAQRLRRRRRRDASNST